MRLDRRASGSPRSRRVAAMLVGSAGLALLALSVFWVADRLAPFPHERLRRAPADVVRAAGGEPLRIFLPRDGRYRLPVRLDEVSPAMAQTLVASEDRWFWWHPGVNPLAVARAMAANLAAGRVVSGGSTIPMQLARLAEPRPRTLASKALEGFRALQLEWHYSKEELLETYLNLTPYGGNLEGVGAAAWFYYGKAAGQLSVGESALLTALPRSPVRYDPTRDPAAAAVARDRVLAQLVATGALTATEAADARRHPVPTRLQRPPFRAPHFARLARARHGAGAPSSLDLEIQSRAEAAVGGRIDALRRQGLGNAAVVVIENGNRAVRAMVGSAGFLEDAFQGQINGALARRSPGSTLKPFLYALAIDRGRLVPDSWLLDVPTDFSGYVAENYDGQYRGRVTAFDALRWSLNAPAVRLLSELGLSQFHQLLLAGGLASLDRPAIHYGLPLVLGAGEVTLLDLTNLYATLADDGIARPYRLLVDERVVPGVRLLSAASARLVTGILLEVERPDLPESWTLTRDVPAVAWKTGTSYGHRDAWAVGYSDRFTIGVWVGNLDGRSAQGISGARHAGPLLFDLFRSIAAAGGTPNADPSGLIATTRVCADSHALPGAFCPRTVEVVTVPGVTALSRCAVHRRAFLDLETGERLAGDCLADRPHGAHVLSVWPAELVAWQRVQGQIVDAVPAMSRRCSGIPADEPLRIISPDAATSYLLRAGAPSAHQRIALTARAGAGVGRLYWYQDGELVASGGPQERLFVGPVSGLHELVVVDDTGRSHAVRYRVE